ncbi:hypothetical protein LCGC14_0455290 [marine sediment metagenome]|uniref:Uncharacterized protein n=1 Tax=marine sediment metagenome TaxID=412755 RepID=A0A0F9SGQ3_9ZZZZ
MKFYRWLRCFLLHRRAYGDRQWELDRMPTRGLKPVPALWRVWRYCQICGRGWTYMVEQSFAEAAQHPNGHDERRPLSPNCVAVFCTPDGKNPREDN